MPTLECYGETVASPATYTLDINIRAGDDVIVTITYWNPGGRTRYDFTGWSFDSLAKDSYGGSTWATATVTHNDDGGTVEIVFPKAHTTLLTPGQIGVWDLEGVDPDGRTRTIASGSATVLPSVT